MREYDSHMLNQHSMTMYVHCMLFSSACWGALDGNKDKKEERNGYMFQANGKVQFFCALQCQSLFPLLLWTQFSFFSFSFTDFHSLYLICSTYVDTFLFLFCFWFEHKMKSHAGCWLDVDWNRQWHRRAFFLLLCCQPGIHDIYFFVVLLFFSHFVVGKGLKLITLTQLEIIEIGSYWLENFGAIYYLIWEWDQRNKIKCSGTASYNWVSWTMKNCSLILYFW